jgi:DNA-binding transcriptional regulator YdaS (Cro superfamily)
MTPADLRAITNSLDDERGTGGQSALARLLGWHHSTVWRKLNGSSRITESDALAIQKARELIHEPYPPMATVHPNHAGFRQ